MEEKTCRDCKYFVISSVDPTKGTCTVERKELAETQKTSTFIKGKLVDAEMAACENYDKSSGWKDSLEHTI